MRSNRIRRYYLPERASVELLNAFRSGTDWRCILKLPGIPADAKVLSVNAAWERKAIGVLIEHESFPDVPDGAMIPDGDGLLEIEWERATLVREDEYELFREWLRERIENDGPADVAKPVARKAAEKWLAQPEFLAELETSLEEKPEKWEETDAKYKAIQGQGEKQAEERIQHKMKQVMDDVICTESYDDAAGQKPSVLAWEYAKEVTEDKCSECGGTFRATTKRGGIRTMIYKNEQGASICRACRFQDLGPDGVVGT